MFGGLLQYQLRRFSPIIWKSVLMVVMPFRMIFFSGVFVIRDHAHVPAHL